MTDASKDEVIGRTYREKRVDRKRLAVVNAELAGISILFKKAGSQLECVLANERSELHSVLSQLNIDHALALLAEREQLNRKIVSADEELRKLGAPP